MSLFLVLFLSLGRQFKHFRIFRRIRIYFHYILRKNVNEEVTLQLFSVYSDQTVLNVVSFNSLKFFIITTV